MGRKVKSRGTAVTEPPHGVTPRVPKGMLALDLVNTVPCGICRTGDGLADPSSTSKWIAAHPEFVPVLRRTLPIRELREIREALRTLLARNSPHDSPPDLSSWDTIGLGQPTDLLIPMIWEGGPVDDSRPGANDPRLSLLSAVAKSGIDLLRDLSTHRIRPCGVNGCSHYLAQSTSIPGRCAPTGCGNSVRVSTHHVKKR